MFQRSFNQALALLKETHRVDNFIPKDYYRTLKLVSKLSLSAKKKKLIVLLMVVCCSTLMKIDN